MKKFILIVCFACISTITFAQKNYWAAQQYSGDKDVTFGIIGGLNLSSLKETVQGTSGSAASGSLTSFHIGLFSDIKISDAFSVQPSLLYTVKGGSDKESISATGFSESSDIKLTLNYLQLPVYALYHAPAGDNDFFVGAGPFISYGISGRNKGVVSMTTDLGGQTQTETTNINKNVSFGSDTTADVKRTDYGVSALVGFKFSNGFLISASYDYGLASIAPTGEGDIKTRVVSVSVGFTF